MHLNNRYRTFTVDVTKSHCGGGRYFTPEPRRPTIRVTFQNMSSGNEKPVVGRGLRKYVSTKVLMRAELSEEAYENPMTAKHGRDGGGGGGGGGGSDPPRPSSIELTSM